MSDTTEMIETVFGKDSEAKVLEETEEMQRHTAQLKKSLGQVWEALIRIWYKNRKYDT